MSRGLRLADAVACRLRQPIRQGAGEARSEGPAAGTRVVAAAAGTARTSPTSAAFRPRSLALQVAYLVRSPYWRSHVEVQPAVLCTQFASREERQEACAKWAVRSNRSWLLRRATRPGSCAVAAHRGAYHCKSTEHGSQHAAMPV